MTGNSLKSKIENRWTDEYLLDTNICIYIIKKKPKVVFEKFRKMSLGEIGISSISLSELNFGIEKSNFPEKNRKALEQFILPLEVLDFDPDASLVYGKVRAQLEKAGNPIGALDTFIAAHALSRNMTLVTNNEKEFSRIKQLKIENWVK